VAPRGSPTSLHALPLSALSFLCTAPGAYLRGDEGLDPHSPLERPTVWLSFAASWAPLSMLCAGCWWALTRAHRPVLFPSPCLCFVGLVRPVLLVELRLELRFWGWGAWSPGGVFRRGFLRCVFERFSPAGLVWFVGVLFHVSFRFGRCSD